jgi:hypothetical protein
MKSREPYLLTRGFAVLRKKSAIAKARDLMNTARLLGS